MALGDLYFFRANVYTASAAGGVTPTLRETRNFYVPYANPANAPATGVIIQGGLINTLYESYVSWMPDFSMLSAVGTAGMSTNFHGYFPETSIVTGGTYVWIENLETNMVYVAGVTPARIYATLADAINNSTPAYTTAEWAFLINNDGSSSSRGNMRTLYYTAVDANGRPSAFKQILFWGSNSTTNQTQVREAWRDAANAAWSAFIGDRVVPPPPPEDPYANGGTTGPGGGDGSFDFSSTDIPIPALPTIGAYDTGLISLYRPSATELRSLASYMWSSAFDINNFIKIFADPGECILGLHIIPTSGSHPVGSSATLMVGNISTGLSMTRLTEQYYECDCGTVTIYPKWGAYLDYSPYSKLSLYLPYIGFVPISPDDCMGGTIRVVYHVDVLSGSCCAYVYCTSNRGSDGHTLYTFTGSCACVCPVTEGQYTNGIIGSIRGGAGLAAGLLTGNVLGGLEDAANALISMAKPDISRSGSFGGSAGLMGIQYPYLVLTVPKMATPEDQNKYIGYPSFITTELADVTGYASIKITHLEGMSATDEEIAELVGLLEEGVIL